ncbi:MAG: PilZ domain-containing protein [Bdellovibrionota bacterium]
MLERRNSDRALLRLVNAKELNGDYQFTYKAKDFSEEGIFLENKFCVSTQEPYSLLSFTLPNGVRLLNLTARIIREERKGESKGCAYEFLNLSEENRMALKRFFAEHTLRGTG